MMSAIGGRFQLSFFSIGKISIQTPFQSLFLSLLIKCCDIYLFHHEYQLQPFERLVQSYLRCWHIKLL